MIVGLTGGIGSGKSTVSDFFSKLGVTIVDTDIIAREAVEPETEALTAIIKQYGIEITQNDGTLNRKKLRDIIFQNTSEKDWLEALLHPIIHNMTADKLKSSSSPYTILASPLLLETSDRHRVNRIAVVDIPFEEQLRRTVMRDGANEEQIKAIIASQLPRQARLDLAHDIIDNSGNLDSTRQQVMDLHKAYLTLAKSTNIR